MKTCVILLLIIALPVLSAAESFVTNITVSPENPDPMAPYRIYFQVSLPYYCWELGTVETADFYVTDTEQECRGGILVETVDIENLVGLPEGHHSITITEHHDGVRDPGQWDHVVEITVGNPPVANEELAWSSIKALYR